MDTNANCRNTVFFDAVTRPSFCDDTDDWLSESDHERRLQSGVGGGSHTAKRWYLLGTFGFANLQRRCAVGGKPDEFFCLCRYSGIVLPARCFPTPDVAAGCGFHASRDQ